jgi:vacuolar-type H+-ATPase subunit H
MLAFSVVNPSRTQTPMPAPQVRFASSKDAPNASDNASKPPATPEAKPDSNKSDTSKPASPPNPLDQIDWGKVSDAFQQVLKRMGPALNKIPPEMLAEITKLVEGMNPKAGVDKTGEIFIKAFGKENAAAILEALKGNPVPLQDQLKDNEKKLDELIDKVNKENDPATKDAIKEALKKGGSVSDPAFQKARELLTFMVGAPAILNFALLALSGTSQEASKMLENASDNPKLKELAKALGMKADELTSALEDKLDPPFVKMLKKLGGNNQEMKNVAKAMAGLLKDQLGQSGQDKLNGVPGLPQIQTMLAKAAQVLGKVTGFGKDDPNAIKEAAKPAAPPKPAKPIGQFLKEAKMTGDEAMAILKQAEFNPNHPELKNRAKASGYPETDFYLGLYELSGLKSQESKTNRVPRLLAAGLDKDKALQILQENTGVKMKLEPLKAQAKKLGLTLDSYLTALQTLAEVDKAS